MQVEAEINKGVDLDIHHQPSMRTSLAVAAHCGYADIVELLIHNGANLNSRDCELSTPLHLASSRGHVDVLKLILAEQVDVNARDSKGRTPFLVAVDAGHLSATRLLLNNGARTMIRGEHQMTALHMAAKEGDLELVSLLLEYGLDLEAKDVHLKVALHHACEQGHVDVTALLLSRNANIEAAGDFKTTPLICAAASGQLEIVKFLLKRGAYAKATDEHRMSALHWAAFNGHLDIVRLLLHRKAPIKATTNQGRTALHLAILNRQFSVAEFLIRSKAPLEIYCREGLTPLHYACNMNNFEVVRLLTSAGANLDAPVEVKRIRPVHIAAALGSLDMIKLFCLNRANIDALDFAGIRALCIACRNGHTAIARELLAAGAELHARSLTVTADDSPLCLAAMGGHADVVSLLLSKGACVEQKDQMGWDAPLYAAHNGHPHVLRLLLEFCLASQRIELPPLFLKVGFSPDAKISHQDKELVKDLVRACDPALSEQPQSTRSSLGIGAIRPSPGASSVSASLSSAHEPLFESVDFGNSAYMLQPARGNIPLSLISTMTQSAIDPHAPVELDTAPELNGQQRSGSFTISRHISGQGSNTVGYLPTILETEPQSPAHTLLSSSNLERFSIPTPPPESPPLQRRRETFNSGGPSSISTPQSGPSPLISAASSRFYTPDTSPNIALTGERVFSSPVISESSTTFYTPDISPDLNWRHKFTHTSQFDSCRDDTPDSSDAGSITSMFTAPEAPEGQTPVFELEG